MPFTDPSLGDAHMDPVIGMKRRVKSLRRTAGGMLVVGLLGALLTSAPVGAGAAPSGTERPNIVVITTDDQTLADLAVMTATQELIGEAGTTFSDTIVSFPLCCPSRATFLTGQYAHNHGVIGNRAPNGGYTALDHSDTLAVWLQESGYTTAHVGKYLNGYGRDNPGGEQEVPPGWSEWFATVGASTYRMYDYTVNDDGALRHYGSGAGDYQTDVLGAEVVATTDRLAPEDTPFFVWFAPLAPHAEMGGRRASAANPRPAPRHEGAFADLALPRPPSFGESDLSDKPDAVAGRSGGADDAALFRLTAQYRARLESLLAVDEAVASIVDALDAAGELDSTVVMFTSDNGFLLGEHGLTGKVWPYEESIRVPLLVRGPGFPAGVTVASPVANIDLAPTIVELAGAKAGREMDGVSLLDVAAHPSDYEDRALLMEAAGQGGGYLAVRTPRWVYIEWGNGAVELYERRDDPYQLRSLHDDPDLSGQREELAATIARLRKCVGNGCMDPG